jgi:putative acetyltransferase
VIEVRPERPEDRAAIRAVVRAALGAAEAELVDALRRDGDLVLSLVAVEDGPVGHVAFCRLSCEPPLRATGLAPLTVRPDRHRRGIGAALVRDGIRRLGDANEDLVVVLGEPAYYGRLGFSRPAAEGLRTPYDGPALQALALSDRGRAAAGAVRYPAAFAGLA